MKKIHILLMLLSVLACTNPTEKTPAQNQEEIGERSGVWLTVLGTVQDGGSPHIGCEKDCCKDLFMNPNPELKVVSLGVIDYNNGKQYLFEATPDFTSQVEYLSNQKDNFAGDLPNGIFLTHAHIGHYTGLMYLGREALAADSVPIYAMPGMKSFLENNGPWGQLVDLGNVELQEISADSTIALSNQLSVIPFRVPHRDEYSETVGYKIIGPRKSLLFIPDIDKWQKWERSIVEEIKNVDYALLDATFFADGEISRDMTEVPHPFVEETIELLKNLDIKEKRKVHFIHFNHTNPLIYVLSPEADSVRTLGFHVAEFGMEIAL